MGLDARLATNLPSHPKTKKLIRRLGKAAAWNLVCLILWTASNRSDGNLSGMTDEDIELSADWDGDDGQFVATLVEVKFLDGSKNCYRLHDWEEHNPWAAGSERRREVAKANAAKKWGYEVNQSELSNAQKRSARLAEARKKGTHTKAEWDAMKDVCGHACVECGETGLDLSKDHILAVCKGGSDSIENIQPMCHRCNASKGANGQDKRPANWREMLAKRLPNVCQSVETSAEMSAPSPSPSPIVEDKSSTLSTAKLPTCPTQDLIDLYHSALPELPSVVVQSPDRQKAMGSFWKWVLTSKRSDGQPRATDKESALSWINEYFLRARDNDFLMGRTNQSGRHSNWRCDFDFLLTEKGKKHVIEKTQVAA